MKTFARPSRIAALVAAGVLGFGGVAAAGPGGFDLLELESDDPSLGEEVVEDEEEIVEDEEGESGEGEIVEEESGEGEGEIGEEESGEDETAAGELVEGQLAAAADGPPDPPLFMDDLETEFFDETLCLAGPHGRTVSAVARGDEGFKGIEVRDAAQSSCGRPWLEPWEPEDENEAAEDESVTETEVEEVEVEQVERDRGRPAHAGGGADKGAKDKAVKGDKGNRGGGKGRGGR